MAEEHCNAKESRRYNQMICATEAANQSIRQDAQGAAQALKNQWLHAKTIVLTLLSLHF
jgi:hypothetical protein